MPCHPLCNQGRNCNGTCRSKGRPLDDSVGNVLLLIGWLFAVGLLAYMVWG